MSARVAGEACALLSVFYALQASSAEALGLVAAGRVAEGAAAVLAAVVSCVGLAHLLAAR